MNVIKRFKLLDLDTSRILPNKLDIKTELVHTIEAIMLELELL